ncbi:hypothetical protein KP509_04G102700 [Ceratopteris richardii]|uniref:Secreted protein n=1 Tax=Ceratopteris richardii TaxID=49495 RepID=A0A8T2V2C3_CERRI|nr:hypothetical protein KP509_04G102700 [Ceratopteris richardii]
MATDLRTLLLPLFFGAVMWRATQAIVLFHNTRTVMSWDSINQKHYGTVQEVTNVVYKGSTAIKCTQVYVHKAIVHLFIKKYESLLS